MLPQDPHARALGGEEAGPAWGAHAGPIDPLDPAQLEAFFIDASGLMSVRPPLPPAQSGDNFYHVIPFQVPQSGVFCGL